MTHQNCQTQPFCDVTKKSEKERSGNSDVTGVSLRSNAHESGSFCARHSFAFRADINSRDSGARLIILFALFYIVRELLVNFFSQFEIPPHPHLQWLM